MMLITNPNPSRLEFCKSMGDAPRSSHVKAFSQCRISLFVSLLIDQMGSIASGMSILGAIGQLLPWTEGSLAFHLLVHIILGDAQR